MQDVRSEEEDMRGDIDNSNLHIYLLTIILIYEVARELCFIPLLSA